MVTNFCSRKTILKYKLTLSFFKVAIGILVILQAFRSGGSFSVIQKWREEMQIVERREIVNLMNWNVMDAIRKIKKELLSRGLEVGNILPTEIAFLDQNSSDRPYYNIETHTLFLQRPNDTDPNKIFAKIWNETWEYLFPEICESMREIVPDIHEILRIFLSQKFTNRSSVSKAYVNDDMRTNSVNCETTKLIEKLHNHRVLFPYLNQFSKLKKDTEKLDEHILKIATMMKKHFEPRGKKELFYSVNSDGMMIIRIGSPHWIKSNEGKLSEDSILKPYVKVLENARSNNITTVWIVSHGQYEIRKWGEKFVKQFKTNCGFKYTIDTHEGSKTFIARLDFEKTI